MHTRKAAKTEHPRVAVFGEAVALLWAEGNAEGAIQLEKLGNDLTKTHKVGILCAYPFSLHIQKDGHASQDGLRGTFSGLRGMSQLFILPDS